MNSAKKARLEGAGWKVGTAAEFLGLNKQEAAFVEMKLALARCLHALRIRRKLSQSRLADLVGSSQSRVANRRRPEAPFAFGCASPRTESNASSPLAPLCRS